MSDFRKIQEAYNSIQEEVIDEILVGGKKLTSKQIVKKIKKNRNKLPTLKAFEPIFAKFSPNELHSRDDLEGMLPDYVNDAEIGALYAEGEEITELFGGDMVSKDMMRSREGAKLQSELTKLTVQALKSTPGSPNQKKVIKKLNVVRKKLGMQPLPE